MIFVKYKFSVSRSVEHAHFFVPANVTHVSTSLPVM